MGRFSKAIEAHDMYIYKVFFFFFKKVPPLSPPRLIRPRRIRPDPDTNGQVWLAASRWIRLHAIRIATGKKKCFFTWQNFGVLLIFFKNVFIIIYKVLFGFVSVVWNFFRFGFDLVWFKSNNLDFRLKCDFQVFICG